MLKKDFKFLILGALLTLSLGVASFGTACAQWGHKPAGKWLAGDFHNHTTLTDGSWTMPDDFAHAKQYGLDWWANSEHGGAFNRDTFKNFLDTLPGVTFLGDTTAAGKSGGHQNMWRWQSLLQFSYPVLDQLRTTIYRDKTIIQGLEWNVPGHEHCSVAIVDESTDPSIHLPVAQFEYLFDGSDKDTIGGKDAPYNFETANHGVAKNTVNNHVKAVQAVSWLQQYYGKKSWTIFAHPERKSLYKINDFRDFNNAAPDVAFGFESIPGHQKSANRGEYGDIDPLKNIADGKQTYGGAGIYSAKVAGLWDAMLSEGRHWWLFVNCDFHDISNDFWLGEYCKNWTFVSDENKHKRHWDGKPAAQEIADGLRSGNTFCVLGDLINALHFSVQQQDDSATMGQTLQARSSKNVKVTIKLKSPHFNNSGAIPKVDHIDLIAGSVTGKISPTLRDGSPNPAYSQINSDAKVIARFTSTDWEVDEDGWTVIQYHLQAGKDMFLRLRGTNQSLTGGQLDPTTGDPLADTLGANNEAAAWADLWFYSNPIFVKAVDIRK